MLNFTEGVKTKLAVVITLSFGFVFLETSANYSEPHPVRYISSDLFGDLLMMPGKKLNPQSIQKTFQNSSLCKCRNTCFAFPSCRSFTTEPDLEDSGKFLCHLTTEGPLNTTYDDDSNAVTVLMASHISGKLVKFMDDYKYYYISTDKILSAKGEDFCRRLLGFRYAIFKTQEEFQTLLKLGQLTGADLFVNLNDQSGAALWGDGTALEIPSNAGLTMAGGILGNNAYDYYITQDLRLVDAPEGTTHHVVCQASNIITN